MMVVLIIKLFKMSELMGDIGAVTKITEIL